METSITNNEKEKTDVVEWTNRNGAKFVIRGGHESITSPPAFPLHQHLCRVGILNQLRREKGQNQWTTEILKNGGDALDLPMSNWQKKDSLMSQQSTSGSSSGSRVSSQQWTTRPQSTAQMELNMRRHQLPESSRYGVRFLSISSSVVVTRTYKHTFLPSL